MKNILFLFLIVGLFNCKSEAENKLNDLNSDKGENLYNYYNSYQETSFISDSLSDVSYDLNEIEEAQSGFDYESSINKYTDKLSDEFVFVKFRNFLIFSNLGEELTYKLIDNDVRNVYDAMYKNYLTVKPSKVTSVFLFQNFSDYRDFSVNHINIQEDDLSPFGFYKISANVVVVRYINWKGSLPHEITHALIQVDFPNISSWFDEGLGTLHERATMVNGKLIGNHNERLRALKRAINENKFTGIEEMMRTSDEGFYGRNSPLYYAIARYVTGYLQHLGLLETYYKKYKSTVFNDRSGVSQLEAILNKDIDEINNDIIEYVLSINTDSNR